jgi:hypothetical protein
MEIKKHLFRTTNFMGHELLKVVTVFVLTAVVSI